MNSMRLEAVEPIRRALLRPMKVAIALSVSGELLLLVVFGMILFPGGNLLTQLLWTVVFCGIGMGSVYGAALTLSGVDRLDPVRALAASTVLSVAILGVACDGLCYRLAHHFGVFGARGHGTAFLACGVLLSIANGIAVGFLCFTPRGIRLLEEWGR